MKDSSENVSLRENKKLFKWGLNFTDSLADQIKKDFHIDVLLVSFPFFGKKISVDA